MRKIVLARPLIDVNDSSKIIRKVLNNNFPNEGEQTKIFEKKICKLLKVKYAVTTTNGTSAIFLALKANGIKYNDEVLIPNITFPATANAVKMAGAPAYKDLPKYPKLQKQVEFMQQFQQYVDGMGYTEITPSKYKEWIE